MITFEEELLKNTKSAVYNYYTKIVKKKRSYEEVTKNIMFQEIKDSLQENPEIILESCTKEELSILKALIINNIEKRDVGYLEYITINNLKSNYLINENCKIIILSHLGRVKSESDFATNTLEPVKNILEKLLNEIGYSVGDIYFTECCKCIIEDRKQLEKCSQNCRSILFQQISSVPCKIIVTMGLHPTQVLLNKKIQRFADYVGKETMIEIENKNYLLFPIYHPSPLNPKGYKDNIPIFAKLRRLINKESA